MPTFYLLRHGLTDDDMPGREKVTGWLDVPLNAQGRLNAARAGRFLKRKGITHIVASELKRAEQTAQIVGRVTGLAVVESDKLVSWDMGCMAGMDVQAAKPFLTFFQKKPSQRPPEGEAFQKFYDRFKAAFYAMVSYVKRFPNSRPLMVTHSQAMDVARWFIRGIEPGGALEFGGDVPPGGVMEVNVGPEGRITLRQLRLN